MGAFQVSSPTIFKAGMDSDGGFVVTWRDGDQFSIYAQRFDASGVAQGAEFQINTYTTSDQDYPVVAMNDKRFNADEHIQ